MLRAAVVLLVARGASATPSSIVLRGADALNDLGGAGCGCERCHGPEERYVRQPGLVNDRPFYAHAAHAAVGGHQARSIRISSQVGHQGAFIYWCPPHSGAQCVRDSACNSTATACDVGGAKRPVGAGCPAGCTDAAARAAACLTGELWPARWELSARPPNGSDGCSLLPEFAAGGAHAYWASSSQEGLPPAVDSVDVQHASPPPVGACMSWAYQKIDHCDAESCPVGMRVRPSCPAEDSRGEMLIVQRNEGRREDAQVGFGDARTFGRPAHGTWVYTTPAQAGLSRSWSVQRDSTCEGAPLRNHGNDRRAAEEACLADPSCAAVRSTNCTGEGEWSTCRAVRPFRFEDGPPGGGACYAEFGMAVVSGTFTDGGTSTCQGYSDCYANNMDRSWQLQCPSGHNVRLSFSSFNVRSGDYVTVYNGESTSDTQLGRFTGSATPSTVTSSGRYMRVRFTSNDWGNRPGFAAIWSCTSSSPSTQYDSSCLLAPGRPITCGSSNGRQVADWSCQVCPAGTTWSEELQCAPILCEEDSVVRDHACEPCPAGQVNTAGDDASGPNTDCAPPGAILCGENERVNRNLPAGRRCVACEPGKTNAAGDNPAGATTECAPICDFASGDGDGVTEEYLGQAPSALVCAALVRETRPEANGATFRAAPKCTYSVRYEQDTDVALRPLRQPDAGCVTLVAETTSNEDEQASLQPELCLETPAPEMDRVLSAVGEESAEAPVCHDTALVVAALVRRNGHCLPQTAPLTKVLSAGVLARANGSTGGVRLPSRRQLRPREPCISAKHYLRLFGRS